MKNEEITVLVEKVQQKEEGSFEALYNELWRKIYYRCYKTLGNEQDAKDAMQTVFIKLFQKIDTLNHPNAFGAFLRTITNNVCLDFHRVSNRNETDELETYEGVLEEDNAEFLPSEAYERQDIREKIAKIIEDLPAKQREAILLFYYENLTIKEIAEITESKFDAVNNRLVTARKTLRLRAEELVKKGALTVPMAILPVSIITKILMEEANAVATAEVGAAAWQGICAGIEVAGAVGVVGTTTATTTAATSSTAVNVGIGLTCAAILAGTIYLGFYVNNTFFNPTPPAIVEEYEENDIFDIVTLIQEINNRPEFIDFTEIFGFMLLSSSRSDILGNRMLFLLEESDRFIYLGYTENLQGNFRVVYEVTEEPLPMTDEAIAEWFARL